MKNTQPSFGHVVLAQILSRTSGHCVLTTNFDSLVESSVYQFTNKTPLVCGHESLSGYARPSKTHPLIIKIHRDLLLSPKSDPDEINKLDPGWKEPLDHIFSTHIPVVVGYGGNDGSLMSYFETMTKPSNFFWCGLSKEVLSRRIKNLVEKHDGSFVAIEGFDELMHELLWVFDEIKPIKQELNEITSERIRIATKQLQEIKAPKIKKKAKPTKAKAMGKERKELSALEYSNLAEKEPDFEKRKQIYMEALDDYPSTGWLWWDFTYFLHFEKKDYGELDTYYLKGLRLNDKEGGLLGNYALFLENIKKDYSKAEKYYLKALAADPNNAINNGNYAVFLKNTKKNYTKADEYYLKALTADPDNASINGNYAQILLEQGRKKEAEKYIKRAFDKAKEHDLLLELWFYRYAHFPEFLEEAEKKIEELLSKGIKSVEWNFSGNIEQAIKKGHPNVKKLKEFARRISNEE